MYERGRGGTYSCGGGFKYPPPQSASPKKMPCGQKLGGGVISSKASFYAYILGKIVLKLCNSDHALLPSFFPDFASELAKHVAFAFQKTRRQKIDRK